MSAGPDANREFDPEFFDFLAELADHNDREWFAANRDRYEAHVLEPALAFIEDFAFRLPEISPHLRADPRRTGGSLFRIHRDTRFSKDKTPYKTHVGINFRHARAKEIDAPGLYLHLAPGDVFAGGGLWRPDTQTAHRIREAIAADPDGWRRATREPPFSDRFQIHGEQLKRVPSTFDREHESADDLRRKGWVGSVTLDQETATTPGFLDEYTHLCEGLAPLLRFICRALALEF
jgi:uncharacterized protein (TIGR02453 family)